MSITFVPAAAGASATVFVAEPVLYAGRELSAKFLAPTHPTTADAVHAILTGASVGLGATTLAACFATSIPIWPGAAIGAGAGAALAAAWHITKAATKAGITWAAKRRPDLVSRAYVRLQEARDRAMGNSVVRLIRDFVAMGMTTGVEVGRVLTYKPTVSTLLPTTNSVASYGMSTVAAVEMSDPTPAGAALVASLGIVDYLRRTGQAIVVKGVTLFTPKQIRIGALAILGLSVVRGAVNVTRNLWAERAERKAREEASRLNAMADAVASTATINVDLPVEFIKAMDAVMSRIIDENLVNFTAAADEVIEEIHQARKGEVVDVDADEAELVEEPATLTSEQVAKVEAQAAARTAEPLIAPIQEAEVRKAQPTMTPAQATQLREDAAALAAGQPLPQKRPSSKKRPVRKPAAKSVPVHTTQTDARVAS